MADIENVVPVGGNAAGVKPEDQGTTVVVEETPAVVTPEGPPPTNAERAEARKAKEEADKAAADAKAKEGEGEGEEEEEETSETETELDTTVWGDAGDDVANSVLQTLQDAEVSVDEAKALLWDAVEAGDPSKVDRDALVEKVGKAKATLIMAGIENVTERNNKRLDEVVGIAKEAAGGEANWNKAKDWARANLDEKQVNEFRDMLDAGGEKAKYAASTIVARYNADPKNTALNAGEKALTPDDKGISTVKGISRREYGEQLNLLYLRGASEAEYNSLKLSRKAGIKEGI